MSTTSATWGNITFWGGQSGGPFCTLGDQRVLYQMDAEPGNRTFRDWICEWSEQVGDDVAVVDQIADAFDLFFAVGAQLDAIGAVVGLPRKGFDDTDYRRFLRVQIQCLQPNSGRAENVLALVRLFVGAVAPPIVLTNAPPLAFTLSVPTIPIDEIPVLFSFLCECIDAATVAQVTFSLGTGFIMGSVNVVVPGAGIMCSVNVPVPGCATMGTVLQTPVNC